MVIIMIISLYTCLYLDNGIIFEFYDGNNDKINYLRLVSYFPCIEVYVMVLHNNNGIG